MSAKHRPLRDALARRMVPPVLHDFVACFNRREFWESHEVLEGAWRARRSDFYQGLILYASAWVHVQRGNARGVLAQLAKAERRLAAYRPGYLGVDVDALLAHAARTRAAVEAGPEALRERREAYAPPVRIVLSPSRVRGTEPELAPDPAGGARGGESV